ASQAVSIFPGGTAAGTTGTLTATVGGPAVADRNNFQNANGVSENNIGVVATNDGIGNVTIENNLFENIAKDGTIAGTIIVRTQSAGGKWPGVVKKNVIQNIAYTTGGRHVIGHFFNPASSNANYKSDTPTRENTPPGITYTATNREFIFVD